MNPIEVPNISTELAQAFLEIQQPRSDYAIEHFVVGDHHGSITREYSQIVEELRRAYSAIKRGLLEQKKLEIEKKILIEQKTEITDIEAEMKQLDIDEIRASLIGKLREFDCLYNLWQKYPKFTHQQLEAGEYDYWKTRLSVQAARDILARKTGISVSSQHGMERAQLAPVPKLHQLIAPVKEDNKLEKKKDKKCLPSS